MVLTRYDTLLIIGFLAIAIVILLVVSFAGGQVNTVIVQVDGKEVLRLPLASAGRYSVQGSLGETEIEIKDKRVRVISSPCRKKICVQTGWISKPHQTIICAPNKVVVRLTGSSDNDVDGITQ